MADGEDGLEVRRKRLRFRAWHRGTRETDLILGRFADAYAASFTAEDIAAFERLLEVPDRDLLDWVTGAVSAPPERSSPMLARLLLFYGTERP